MKSGSEFYLWIKFTFEPSKESNISFYKSKFKQQQVYYLLLC